MVPLARCWCTVAGRMPAMSAVVFTSTRSSGAGLAESLGASSTVHSVSHQRPPSADAGRLGAHSRWPTRPWRIVPVLAASRSSRNVVQTSPPLHEARRCESREQLEIDLGDLWEQRGTRPLTLEDCRAIQECEDGGCRCTECRFADEEP